MIRAFIQKVVRAAFTGLSKGAALSVSALAFVCLHFADDAAARGGISQSAAPVSITSQTAFELLSIAFGLTILVLIVAVTYLVRKGDAMRLESQMRAEKFDQMINHLSQGVAAFDATGRMTFANQSYFKLYNLDPSEFRDGAHIHDFLLARVRAGTFRGSIDDYTRDMREAAEGGAIVRRLIELPDGRTISVLRAPMPDGGWVSTHEDVSEQIRLRKDVQAGKDFLQKIIDKFPLGLSVIDVATQRYTMANRASEAFYFCRTDQVVGHSIEDVFPSNLVPRIYEMNEAALASEDGECRAEFSRFFEDKEATVLSRRIVLKDEDGKPEFLVTILEDVSEMRRLSREVEASKRFLEHIIDSLPISVVVKSADDLRYMLVNRRFEQLTGKTREEVIGKSPNAFYSAEDAENVEKFDRAAIAGVVSARKIVSTHHAPDGKKFSFQTQRHVIYDDNQKPELLISLFEDITEQKNLTDEIKENKLFLEQVIDEIPVALLVKRVDDGTYVTCNRQAEKMIGKPRDQVVGMRLDDVAGPMTIKDVASRDRVAIAMKGEVFTAEVPLVRQGQPAGLLLTRRVAIGEANGKAKYLVTTYADVTDRRQNEQRLAYMAFHDALTRLPNRAAFVQSLEQMIESCRQIEEKFAVISIDLDRFKEINDVCGHAFGDKLLAEVAKRIQAAALGAVVARLSGDEFGLIIDGEQPEAGRELATRIVQAMKDEFEIDGQSVRASLTCGIAIYPDNGFDAAALLANADVALSRGKANARGSIRFFEAEMDLQLREMRALHHDLASAMKNSELFLHYQPQAIAGLEIVGFESLIRWKHPSRGMVPPSAFIPIAEESGLIIELGEWILREACREAASWKKPLQIAVNLSPAQFQHGDLVGLVHSILLETGLAPSRLELEITEGVLIRDFDRGLSLLRRLKALGVKIAMDDFGSGYSSLAYLQAFPFDKIKIDRDFVMNLGRNKQSAAIIRSVIGLGHGLNVPIVAEGVETQEQLQFLIDESCDQYQGYFIGRPNLISEFAEVIGRDSGKSQKVSSVA